MSMPTLLFLFTMITLLVSAQEDSKKEGTPTARQSAEADPANSTQTLPAAPTIRQPSVMKSENSPQPLPWTTWGPFAASGVSILVSLGTVWITQRNSRRMLDQQNAHALAVLREQKEREHQMWEKQRRWEAKRDLYADVLACLAHLEHVESKIHAALRGAAHASTTDDVALETVAPQKESYEALSSLEVAVAKVQLLAPVGLRQILTGIYEGRLGTQDRLDRLARIVRQFAILARQDLGIPEV